MKTYGTSIETSILVQNLAVNWRTETFNLQKKNFKKAVLHYSPSLVPSQFSINVVEPYVVETSNVMKQIKIGLSRELGICGNKIAKGIISHTY